MLSLGAPPLRVSARYGLFDGGDVNFRVSVAGNRISLLDAGTVKVYSLAQGGVTARVEPLRTAGVLGSLLSSDGTLLAIKDDELRDTMTMFRVAVDGRISRTFRRPSASPLLFPLPDRLLVRGGYGFELLETSSGTPVYQANEIQAGSSFGFAYSVVGGSVLTVSAAGLHHWDGTTNQSTLMLEANPRWTAGAIAARSRVAVVADATGLLRLDLDRVSRSRVNVATPVAMGPSPTLRISPSGTRVLVCDRYCERLHLFDLASGAELYRLNLPVAALTVTYSDDDDVFAYVGHDRVIHVVNIRSGERAWQQPARFAGWLSGSSAALSENGVITSVDVGAKLHASSATPDLLPPAPPRGAPSWATWVSTGTDGAHVAAVPSPPQGKAAQYPGECPTTLRVFTERGGVRVLKLRPTARSRDEMRTDGRHDPCWRLSAGRVLALTVDELVVYDPVTGKRRARLVAGGRASKDHVYRHDFYAAQLSPDGNDLALWWRRPEAMPPAPANEHDDEEDAECTHAGSSDACMMETVAEVWDLRGKQPRRRWQSRLDSHRAVDVHVQATHFQPLPKNGSGPIAFTQDGRHVLFGFVDGDILVRDVGSGAIVATESLHHGAITRIELSPDDSHLFSEDDEGEQRLWPLARP